MLVILKRYTEGLVRVNPGALRTRGSNPTGPTVPPNDGQAESQTESASVHAADQLFSDDDVIDETEVEDLLTWSADLDFEE